ncbi:UvrD-helicase domain-containing protein [bacterium]|nr:UvrD-helicase domain-containing protein [bacterium]
MAINTKSIKYLVDLNEEQLEAVTFGEGPLLIVAGAGTGKTTVITRRIAYLIEQKSLKPEEILAVTFTDKAAEEMEERVDKLLPYGYLDLWISTFHSFAQRILQEYGLDIGLPTNFKVLDPTSAWLLIRKNLDRFNLDYYRPLGNPTKFIHALIEHFARCKDQGIYPEDYLEYAKKIERDFKGENSGNKELNETEVKRIKEIAKAYETYQQILLENSALDFGDLINYTLLLFRKRPQILKKYRDQFKYILVDEFQDTNWAQYELIKLLAAPKNNLTVCADDDQSIYRWRGASFNNVLRFKEDFPEAKEVILIRNYRSTQDILDLAYKFIQLNNPNRLEYQLNQVKELSEQAKKIGVDLNKFKHISKKLVAQTKEKGIIEHLHFKTLEEEVRGVADKIEELYQNKSAESFSDFAILVRSNNAAVPFSKELERRGIPYQFLASKGLYLQPVILDIIAYLKLLDNYHESSAVFRILTSPIFDIPYEEIVAITNTSRKKAQSLYETLKEIEKLDGGISKETKEKIHTFLDLVQKHSKIAESKNVSSVFISFLNDSGYLAKLVKENKHKELNNLCQFYKKIKGFEETQTEPILKNFMELLNMELEAGETGRLEFDIEEGPETVKIMTIHSAKGLEFKYVFLVNLVDKRFPTNERKDPIQIPDDLIKDILPLGDVHLQEERRLFYVGITRAKRGLFFTSAEDYGGLRKKKLSRFLYELGIEKDISPVEQKELFSLPKIAVIKSKTKLPLPPYFSYTQLAAFEKCPLQYKFAHILKIPRAGSATLSFGKTMHNTLLRFVKESIVSNQLSLERLYEIYNEEWIDEWYESKSHKEQYYQLGKNSLKMFFERFKEKSPKIKEINGVLALELPFSLKIKDYTIKGKIDRIDELEDGTIEIIDYKTGKPKEKLNKEEKEQLLIYQLAAEEVLKLQPKQLTYYYLDAGQELSFPSIKEKEEFKEKIVQEIEKIQNSEFEPTPGFHCKFCDFKHICEFRKSD